GFGDRLGDVANSFRSRARNRANRGRAAFRLIDLALLLGLRGFYLFLLFAFGIVDERVTPPFRFEDDRAFFAFRAHLPFHRLADIDRRFDVLDLVPQHLDAPRDRGLIDLADDLRVDVGTLLKGAIQIDFADFASYGCLRKLDDSQLGIGYTIRRFHRIDDL